MKNTLILLTALLLAPLAALAALHAQKAPLWVLPEVAAPRVQRVLFDSKAAGRQVSCHVFTPEDYEREKELRFPVLYWLHGTGGGLPGIAPVSAWFDTAIREGKIPPMLVVFPNGLASSMWCDSKDGAVPMETIVTKELIPHIDAAFRTIARREGRIVEGFSMGAWVTYGLGSESQNLPGFVVINCGTIPSGGAQNFSNGFLPAIYQGTVFKSGENPLADVRPREEKARQLRKMDLVRRLDTHSTAKRGGDTALDAALSNYEMAFRMQSAVPELRDLRGESQATIKLYGIGEKTTDAFGRGCLMARRMVERGVRFVQVTTPDVGFNRWDQHQDLEKGHRANAAATDRGAAGLIHDLESRGLLKDTLVIWGGEFGRPPGAQAPRGAAPPSGRDHNPHGFTLWMAGGGMKPGLTFGATDDYGYAAIENKVHVHDLHATILHLLGFDHERLTWRHAGRDFRLTDVSGEVAEAILA